MTEAQAEQKSGDILAAERAYREIAQDFSTFRDVNPQMDLARSLAESGEFRKARKNEKAALELQDEVTKKIGNLVAGINRGTDQRTDFFSQLQSAVNDAYRDKKESSSPWRRQAIERGLASAFAYAVESGQQAMLKKDFGLRQKTCFRPVKLSSRKARGPATWWLRRRRELGREEAGDPGAEEGHGEGNDKRQSAGRCGV